MKKVLSIAGSDCSGGAGIQADLKTFSAHGVFGMSVIVSVVAENTSRVIDIQDITPDMIEKQIDAVFEDIEVDAVKIGILSSSCTILSVGATCLCSQCNALSIVNGSGCVVNRMGSRLSPTKYAHSGLIFQRFFGLSSSGSTKRI